MQATFEIAPTRLKTRTLHQVSEHFLTKLKASIFVLNLKCYDTRTSSLSESFTAEGFREINLSFRISRLEKARIVEQITRDLTNFEGFALVLNTKPGCHDSVGTSRSRLSIASLGNSTWASAGIMERVLIHHRDNSR